MGTPPRDDPPPPDPSGTLPPLSRRERQIMDVLYRRRQASAADVLADLPDPPSYSAVRALLRILERKGHAKHKDDGGRYLYAPTRPRASAGRTALRRLVATFFDNSAAKAIAALIDESDAAALTPDDLDRLAQLIDKARKEGR